ncbi:MAG: glycosyltransferase [Saprospiraceae bacterium]|nr:glycosyltransferase [Saprospiraceae bacterium]
MKYSIIIATYNRIDELQELFESIDRLDIDTHIYEIVIADDGSQDGTGRFIQSLHKPYSIQYLYQENKGPGAARNLAMDHAKGEYFIFIDSDVLLPRNYLSKIEDFLSKHEVDAFGGPDDSHPSFPDFLKAVNYSMTSFLGTGGTRGSKKSLTRFYPRSFNMGIHRRVYQKIGGMSALRHGQDMDYSARIYNAGFRVALIPEAKVYHKRRTSLWRFFKQIFNWGVARVNLGRAYPEMLRFVHIMPAIIVVCGAIIIVLAPFFLIPYALLLIGLVMAVLVALTAFIQSFLIYRSLSVSLLSVVTLFTQVFAYGLGLISGGVQILIGRENATGITKNYYR